MTTGSLYYHFSSKEQIVYEILDLGHKRVLQEVKQAIVELGDSATCMQRVKVGILTHIRCLLGDDSFPAANVRIFSHVPREVRISTLNDRQIYERYWEDLLRNCQKCGAIRNDLDPHVLAFLLFGAMNWTLEWFSPGRHTIESVAGDLTKLLMAGDHDKPGAGRRARKQKTVLPSSKQG